MQWTVLKLIEWTKAYFEKHGVPNPRLDAELLLAHTLSLKRIDLYLQHDRQLTKDELSDFMSFIKRRAKREPLQYITGVQEFFGIPIKVTPKVMIPRPETELLVEEVLKRIDKEEAWSILDVGTGSGAILAAFANELPNAKLTGIDVSEEAASVARENLRPFSERSEVLVGDLFEALKRPFKFDIIVSNPPYISIYEKGDIQPEVAEYEPPTALFTDDKDGLDYFKRIADDSRSFLNDGGMLAFEIGIGQSKEVLNILKRNRFADIEAVKDFSGIERIVIARFQEASSGQIDN